MKSWSETFCLDFTDCIPSTACSQETKKVIHTPLVRTTVVRTELDKKKTDNSFDETYLQLFHKNWFLKLSIQSGLENRIDSNMNEGIKSEKF